MADSRIGITFTGKDALSPVVRGIRSSMDQFKKDARGGFGLAAGMSIWGVATDAIGGVVNVLKGAAQGAMEEERSLASLDTALRANIANWDGNRDAIDEAINARINLGFADTDLRQSFQELIVRTKDVNEALDLQAQAMDLARFKQIDLQAASLLVGKAYSGQVSALRRAGLAIDATATSTQALAQLQQATGGQAVAWADSTEGAFATMELQLGEAQEAIGLALLPAMKELATFVRDDVVPQFLIMLDTLGQFGDAFNDFNRMINPAVAFTQDLYKGALDLAEGMGLTAEEARAATDEILAQGSVWSETTTDAEKYEILMKAINEALVRYRTIAEVNAVATERNKTAWITAGKAADDLEVGLYGVGRASKEMAYILADTWGSAANTATAAGRDIAGNLTTSLRQMIRDGRADVRASAAELSWALKHPFSDEEYANWLERRINRASQKRLRAQKRGDRDAVAEIDRHIAVMRGKLTELTEAGFITKSEFYMASIPTAPEHRAGGGPVDPGNTYVVGERGPELLVMGSRAGHVVANGGNAGRPIVVNVDGQRLFEIVDRRMGRQLAMGG